MITHVGVKYPVADVVGQNMPYNTCTGFSLRVAIGGGAGSASGPTTDPVLIQVQQDFMAASGQMQQAGLSPAFFAVLQNTLTSK